MAANNAYSVSQTQLGAAIEGTRGTAAAPAYWFPVKAPKYKPDLTLIQDDTLQGSMVSVYELTRGLRYDSHGWDSFPYLDTFPLLVRAEFGSEDLVSSAPSDTTLSAPASAGATTIATTASLLNGAYVVIGTGATLETHKVTGSASPYTLDYPLIFDQSTLATVRGLFSHTFSLLNNQGTTGNQPPSLSLSDFDGEEWRQITAAQLDELTLKGNATGYLDYTCTFMGNPSIYPSPTPTPAYTTTQAVPGWRTQFSIGGSYLNYILDYQFDWKRGVKPIPALTGTEAYFMYFANALVNSGKLTVVNQSGAPQLVQYLTAVQQPFDITICDDHVGYALNIHADKCQFSTGELDRSKVEEVEAILDFWMLPNTHDALAGGVSPCTVTIANAQSASY